MKSRLALVVPGLLLGGGVPSVARFVRDTAVRSGRFELSLVSLSMSAHDPYSANLAAPHSWSRGAMGVQDTWESFACTHVGAVAGELEFQRYRPRAALTRALAGCDLVQVVCGSPAWANTVLGLGRPVALQVATLARVERQQRSAHSHGAAGWWRKAMTRVTAHLDDRGLRGADAIQVENPWMLDYAQQLNRARDADIRYAPPGIDAQRFAPIAFVERTRDPYILCVGRLDDPRKRIGLLLEAYAQLSATPRVRLVLAGAGAPPPTFWQRADALGLRERISYTPKPDRAALLDLYQHAAAFALPSDEEGFGMVVIEAMACGVPVVATRCGGPNGIITDGEDGFLVPRDDAAAMAARLRELLDDPARNEAMGAAARATVERRYDERVAGAVFIDMWHRLLQQRTRR